jgi:acetyltransferase
MSCWLGDGAVRDARRIFRDAGVAGYATPEDAIRAFEMLQTYRRNQQTLLETPEASANRPPDVEAAREVFAKALEEKREWLDESEAKAVLAAYGVPVVRTQAVAPSAEAAVAAAEAIGYPVALKILSRDITHKSDVGGVKLNLDHARAVERGVAAMLEAVAARMPQARVDGFTVQEMIRRPHAQEIIVGASIDAVFGPVLLCGQGGTAVEVLADRAIALPPLNRNLAREMLSRTRVSKLLAGYRDRPPAQVDALYDVLVAVSQMLADLPLLCELDINPLLVDEDGVIALDARIRVARAPVAGAERFAILPVPAGWTETVHWDGRDIVVRPIRPEDEEMHRALLARMDPDDIRMRFFQARRELGHDELARLTQIDYDREMAFVAVGTDAHGHPETLGVVRVIGDPDNTEAEFAIMVRSDLKRRGLGALLLERIVRYAKARGTPKLVAHVLRENDAMLKLGRDGGFERQRTPFGDDAVKMVLDVR